MSENPLKPFIGHLLQTDVCYGCIGFGFAIANVLYATQEDNTDWYMSVHARIQAAILKHDKEALAKLFIEAAGTINPVDKMLDQPETIIKQYFDKLRAEVAKK